MPRVYQIGDEPVPGSGYRLVGFLGRGGFGEVWKATAPGGTEVAVKILSLGDLPGQKELRSLQLVKRIRHPNLVPLAAFWLKGADGSVLNDSVLDTPVRAPDTKPEADQTKETVAASPPFSRAQASELIIAMGLGDKSLMDLLDECMNQGLEGVPQEDLLDYMEEAARAIDYLNSPVHDLGAGPVGIQHCDIKPHNIMVVGDATQVCDFGLARMIGTDRTTSGGATLAYAAPECLARGKPSDATDQYSLAITYYELKTGYLPYVDDTYMAVIEAKRKGNLDYSKVSEREQVVLQRATSLEPGKRFGSCMEMVKSLRGAVAGKADAPGDAADGGRAGRLIAVFVATVLFSLASLGGWMIWGPGATERTVAGLLSRAAERRELDDLEGAVKAYHDAIALDPQNASAYFGRGRCYLEQGDCDTAIDDFLRAGRLDAQRYGRHEELANAYLARGTRFLQQADYQRAVGDLDSALAIASGNGLALSRRGTVLLMQGRYEEAVGDFAAAIEADADPSDYIRRGRAYQKLGRLEEAVADYREATRLAPSAEAYCGLGDALLAARQHDDAIAALSEAIRIGLEQTESNSALVDALVFRASGYVFKGEHGKAAADLTEAIRRGPHELASLHRSRAECFDAAGLVEQATTDRRIAALLDQVDHDPNDHEAHNELAYYLAGSPYEEIRHARPAIEHATTACELTEWQESEYLDTLAAAYAAAGDFATGKQWAEKAVDEATTEEARKRYEHTLQQCLDKLRVDDLPTPAPSE